MSNHSDYYSLGSYHCLEKLGMLSGGGTKNTYAASSYETPNTQEDEVQDLFQEMDAVSAKSHEENKYGSDDYSQSSNGVSRGSTDASADDPERDQRISSAAEESFKALEDYDVSYGPEPGVGIKTASRLRKKFQVVEDALTPDVAEIANLLNVSHTPDSPAIRNFKAMLNNEDVGFLTVAKHPAGGYRVAMSELDPALHGLGLGKKMYGETMRRLPNQGLRSDTAISDKARRVWESFRKERGYTSQRMPDGTSLASLPAEASLAKRASIPAAIAPKIATFPGTSSIPSAGNLAPAPLPKINSGAPKPPTPPLAKLPKIKGNTQQNLAKNVAGIDSSMSAAHIPRRTTSNPF